MLKKKLGLLVVIALLALPAALFAKTDLMIIAHGPLCSAFVHEN